MKLVLHARHMGQFLPNGDAFQQWSKQAGHHIVSRVPALHKQAASLSSSHLDRLYNVIARAASKGRISSPYDVQQVCQAMDDIPLEDLGLDPTAIQMLTYNNHQSSRSLRANLRQKLSSINNRAAVTYMHIYEDPAMTIGIFTLPSGSRIPLHNHPGMTVFSRLLYGTLHVRAYDWSELSEPSSSGSGSSINNIVSDSNSSSHYGVRSARLVTDRVLTAPAPTSVLYPAAGGNIHAFTAVSGCAILDVLTPPYAPKDGRDCTYYREVFPEQLLDDDGNPVIHPAEAISSLTAQRQSLGADIVAAQDIRVGLQECDQPADFHVSRQPYLGRKLGS